MAKQNNNGNGGTSGHGQSDFVAPPGPVYPAPAARSSTNADWVQQDMLYKTSVPQQKFY